MTGVRTRSSLAAILLLFAVIACATGRPAEPYIPDFAEPFELAADDVVEPPEVIERSAPTYPSDLRRAGIEGSVVVRVVVGRDGRMTDPEVVRSDHPSLSEATLEMLRGWRFRPATVNGEPVAVYYEVSQRFSLGSR